MFQQVKRTVTTARSTVNEEVEIMGLCTLLLSRSIAQQTFKFKWMVWQQGDLVLTCVFSRRGKLSLTECFEYHNKFISRINQTTKRTTLHHTPRHTDFYTGSHKIPF